MSQVVVLAGGLATRMLPATSSIPKVLLPVAGRPFLDHLLGRLSDSGIDDVLLLTGHLGELVEAHVATRTPSGMRVATRSDGGALLGTGGALKAAEDLLAEAFVVTYGDSYLGFDYRAPLVKLEARPTAAGCMALYRNEGRLAPSNARVEGEHVAAYDKVTPDPRFDFIDYGATALRRNVVAALPNRAPFDIAPVFSDLAARGELLAHLVATRFFEIGSTAGLADLEAHLALLGGALP